MITFGKVDTVEPCERIFQKLPTKKDQSIGLMGMIARKSVGVTDMVSELPLQGNNGRGECRKYLRTMMSSAFT